MNVAELKVDLVQLIMAIDEENTLRKMMKVFKDVAQKEDWWDEIPVLHQARILQSYKDSFNSENWIDHEDVKKQHAKWLQK